MTGPDSPLQVIKQTELELRRRVEDACRQAADRVQLAREEARRTVLLAGEQARAEAAARYQQEIELAHRQAEAMIAAAQDEAGEMRRLAMTRMDDVASWIVDLVVPRV